MYMYQPFYVCIEKNIRTTFMLKIVLTVNIKILMNHTVTELYENLDTCPNVVSTFLQNCHANTHNRQDCSRSLNRMIDSFMFHSRLFLIMCSQCRKSIVCFYCVHLQTAPNNKSPPNFETEYSIHAAIIYAPPNLSLKTVSPGIMIAS